jgi:NAD(P)-dependent dehydrogenase (short-subunit alcohol dehydrogenase family)
VSRTIASLQPEATMYESLRGKRIVITGGTGGLGSAVVQAFADEGATCEVTARHAEASSSDRVRYHAVDVADETAVSQFYTGLGDVWASVHLVGGFAMSPVAETSLDAFRKMFEANAVTCFLCCREAVKAMRAGGAGGRIVNVGSKPALIPTGGMIAYTASKAAVASITQSLAEELKSDDILVNAVVPSIMDTPVNRKAMPNADHSKWPKVEQVAQAILFLASGENSLTSGALVPVYGKS